MEIVFGEIAFLNTHPLSARVKFMGPISVEKICKRSRPRERSLRKGETKNSETRSYRKKGVFLQKRLNARYFFLYWFELDCHIFLPSSSSVVVRSRVVNNV